MKIFTRKRFIPVIFWRYDINKKKIHIISSQISSMDSIFLKKDKRFNIEMLLNIIHPSEAEDFLQVLKKISAEDHPNKLTCHFRIKSNDGTWWPFLHFITNRNAGKSSQKEISIISLKLSSPATQAHVKNMGKTTNNLAIIKADNYQLELETFIKKTNLANKKTCYTIIHNRIKPCNNQLMPCPVKITTMTKLPLFYKGKLVSFHASPLLCEKGLVEHVIVSLFSTNQLNQSERTFTEINQKIKKTHCLAAIKNIQSKQHESLEKLLENIVNIIPSAMRLHYKVSAKMYFRNKFHESANFTPSLAATTVPLMIKKQIAGYLEIHYHINKQIAINHISIDDETSMWLQIASRITDLIIATTSHKPGKMLKQPFLKAFYKSHIQYLHTSITEKNKKCRELQQQLNNVSKTMQNRIAFELHDEIGQQITGIKYLLSNLLTRTQQNKPDAIELLKEVMRQFEKASSMVKKLSYGISLFDIRETGFIQAISHMKQNLEKVFEICIIFTYNCSIHDIDIATNVYYVIKEILYNSIKHSNADEIVLNINNKKNKINIRIRDNGNKSRESSDDSIGLGLNIIKNRLESIQGTISIQHDINKGTLYQIVVAHKKNKNP